MKYRTTTYLTGTLFLMLTIFNCALGERFEEEFKKTIPLSQNGDFSLENVNGSIEVTSWDKAEVKIVARKSVRAGSQRDAERFMERLKIEITSESNRIKVVTEHPRRSGNSSFWDLFSSSKNIQFSVSYEIVVPRECSLDIHTTNGKIYIEKINGAVKARSTNGALNLVDINGDVTAKTTNGSIKAEILRIQPESEVELRTTNGRISVTLPENLHADITARTTNGSISTDFPLEIVGKYSSKKIAGTIGDGGGKIDLRTTNGSISINSR